MATSSVWQPQMESGPICDTVMTSMCLMKHAGDRSSVLPVVVNSCIFGAALLAVARSEMKWRSQQFHRESVDRRRTMKMRGLSVREEADHLQPMITGLICRVL